MENNRHNQGVRISALSYLKVVKDIDSPKLSEIAILLGLAESATREEVVNKIKALKKTKK